MIKKNFDEPDEQGTPVSKLTADFLDLDGYKLQRTTAQPGWEWSVDLAPVVKTDTCQADHIIYIISGKMGLKLDSGQEMELAAGDATHIPPGHDGWTIGGEPVVWLELPH